MERKISPHESLDDEIGRRSKRKQKYGLFL